MFFNLQQCPLRKNITLQATQPCKFGGRFLKNTLRRSRGAIRRYATRRPRGAPVGRPSAPTSMDGSNVHGRLRRRSPARVKGLPLPTPRLAVPSEGAKIDLRAADGPVWARSLCSFHRMPKQHF